MYHLYPSHKPDAKTVVLSSGLGGHAHFWQPQIAHLQQDFHVFVYDQAGVSAESAQLPDDYKIEHMAAELWLLLQQAKIEQCYLIGHALGAFIGLELAKLAPQCVEKLILLNAWDALDAHTQRCFDARLSLLNHVGVAAYVKAQALFLYPPQWISEHDQQLAAQEEKMIAQFAPIANVKKRLDALRCYLPNATAKTIQQPCLVISQQDDFLVPWQRGLALSRLLENSDFELIPMGAHAATVTQATLMNTLMSAYLLNEKEHGDE